MPEMLRSEACVSSQDQNFCLDSASQPKRLCLYHSHKRLTLA